MGGRGRRQGGPITFGSSSKRVGLGADIAVARTDTAEGPSTGDESVITVTRLNGHKLVVNAELIKTVEQTPDTMLTLLNGDHIMVAESVEEIVERAVEYGRSLRAFAPP